MDVKDYEYIVAIADHGNITRAATSLYISQPALTKFLQRTEHQLGVSLFSRQGNHFVPTEAGKAYIEAGRSIIAIDNQLSERLNRELAVQKQLIRIGYSMGRTDEILGKVLPLFYKQYPTIQVKAVADTSAANFASLAKGDLDLAMVVLPNQPVGFQQISLEKSRLSLVVKEDDPLISIARQEEGRMFPSVSLADLKHSRFVVSGAYTNSGKNSHRLLAQCMMSDRIALEVSDINSCLTAVENGLGVGIMFSIPLGLHKLKFLSIREIDAIEQTNSLLYRADWEPSQSAQYLINLIKKCER